MTKAASSIALMSALALPDPGEGQAAPEWVHILPASSGKLETVDGRGPYFVTDAQAIIAASMADGEIPIDQDHSIAKAAPNGQPAPARGWITEMAARADGIWAKVRWTDTGRELVASQSYRKLSPVIRHKRSGEIVAVREVSLVNRPNLRGLAALNQESTEMLREELAKMLGLDDDATDEQVLSALKAKMADKGGETAAQSVLDPIAKAAGLDEGASADAIIVAVQAAKAASDEGTDELTSLQARLEELETTAKRGKSEAFIDAAIREGRVGVKAQRDEFISLHMADAGAAEKIISGLPTITGRTGTDSTPPKSSAAGKAGLTAEQAHVCSLMGMNPEDYAKSLAELGEREEAL